MVKCSFCGKQCKQSKLRIFVEVSGKIHNLCSSKCRRNWKLGRDPKSLGWTKRNLKKIAA